MLLVVVRRRVLAGGRAAVGLDLLLVVVGVGDGRVGGNGQSLSQSVSRLAPGGWAPITQAIHTYIHTPTYRAPQGHHEGRRAVRLLGGLGGHERRERQQGQQQAHGGGLGVLVGLCWVAGGCGGVCMLDSACGGACCRSCVGRIRSPACICLEDHFERRGERKEEAEGRRHNAEGRLALRCGGSRTQICTWWSLIDRQQSTTQPNLHFAEGK